MKPTWKWIIGIFVGICLITLGATWYLSRHWKPIVDSQLKQIVANGSDSLYAVEYDDIALNVLTGNVAFKNFRLIADSNVYKRLKRERQAPDNRFLIRVANLEIRDVDVRKALFSKVIEVDEIRIDTPRVTLINEYHRYNDTLKTDSTAHEDWNLLGSLKRLSVGKVSFKNIYFDYHKLSDTGRMERSFERVQLTVRDILIDSLSRQDTSRFFYTKSIDFAIGPHELEIPNSYYKVGFDSLHLRTARKQLQIKGLYYNLRLDKPNYYQEIQRAKDVIDLHFGSLSFEQLDLVRFMRSQRIFAGKLKIDSGRVNVSNDLRYPRYPKNKIGRSPHQQLMKLNHPIKVDTVWVNDVDISYAEMSGKFHKEGIITFERAGGWLANVTNDTVVLRRNPQMTADLTAYMMNAGKLHALFSFDMLDKQGSFTYKGTLGPMDGTHLNRILTPLLNAEVSSAKIKGVSFDMQGNDYRNWGSFLMDYEDLTVNLLKMDDEGETSKKGLVSFLANEFLINTSNPDGNGKYHTGTINYRRPAEFSFFKTLWKSLLEGIKQTAGISKERETRLMNTVEAAKNVKEKTSQFFNNLFRKRDKQDEKNDEVQQ